MSWLEVAMLVCFGVSWPVSILKAVRTKVVAGKSPVFMIIVCLGYLSGVLHKVIYALDWVVVLYAVNLTLVALDLALYLHYAKPQQEDDAVPVLP